MRIYLRQIVVIGSVALSVCAGCSSETPQSLLASGKDYLAKGDTKSAVIQLKNALQNDANLTEARFLLGKALLDTGDAVSAEKELRKALELGYSADQVVPLLARALVSIGKYKEVDELADTKVSSPASKAELMTALGEAKFATGDVNAARRAFSIALAAQPGYIPAEVGQARIVASEGDLAKAHLMADAALARMPSYYNAWQLKGQIFAAQQQYDQALAAYHKAVQARPDFAAGHFALVSLLIQQNKLDEAATQIGVLRKIAPQQSWFLDALLKYQQKNFTKARDAVLQVLRVQPDLLSAVLLAGAIEFELESYEQAETHLSKVLQRAPGQASARRLLVLTYLRSSQPVKAMEALKPAMEQAENDPALLSLAGEVYMANGQAGKASVYFTKASSLAPSDARNRTSLATAHLASGETELALGELERAAAIDSSSRADLALIGALMQRRDYDKALEAIGKLEKKEPRHPLAQNLRGTVLLAKGDRDGARRSFERALELDPKYFPATSSLASMDLANKNVDGARKRYEQLISRDPKNRQAILALALLLATTGSDSPEVTALLKKAVAENPGIPGPRLALMGYYVGRKDLNNAVAAARDSVAALPSNPEVLEAAGQTYQTAGDINQAISVYNKLAAIRPGSVQPYVRMAEAQLANKDKDGARESLRKALSINPNSLQVQRMSIGLYLESGQQKEAIGIAKEVQRQNPRQSVGYVLEGDIYAFQKNWGEAAKAYRSGLERVDSTDLATKLYGALLASSGPAAEQFAGTWLREHPKDGAFRMYLAQAAHMRQDYRNALQQYRKLLEVDANDPWLLNNLASVEAQMKDSKALEHAEKANSLAPNQPAIMDTLGALLIDKGDTARGLSMLQKAAELAPGAAAIRLNLAKAHIKAGQKDAARKELDELAKLGDKFSGHAEVTQLKQKL